MFSSWFIKLSPAESCSGGEGVLAIFSIFRLGLVFPAGRRRVVRCKRKPEVPARIFVSSHLII